ncbi:hypothetical protein ACSMXN_05285 [Jatrophihabitans sp. DSM 45814]
MILIFLAAIVVVLFFGILSLPVEALIFFALLASQHDSAGTALLVTIAASIPLAWAAARCEREAIANWASNVWHRVRDVRSLWRAVKQAALDNFNADPNLRPTPGFRDTKEPTLRQTLRFPPIKFFGLFFVSIWVPLAAAAVLGSIGAGIASGLSHIHKADPEYVEVVVICAMFVGAIGAADHWLARPIVEHASVAGSYEQEYWKDFRDRRELMVEGGWALLVAAIAFVPAALGSSWLPFVAFTAISCALIVPRYRLWKKRREPETTGMSEVVVISENIDVTVTVERPAPADHSPPNLR